MVGKVTELIEDDLVETAARIFALAQHLHDRPLAGKTLVLFVQPQLGPYQRNEIFRIASIQNRETRLDSYRPAIAPQQEVRHRMERAATHSLTPRTDQVAHTSQHFLSRLARKREQQNVRGIDAGIDQIRHAIDEQTALATAGASNHQRGG